MRFLFNILVSLILVAFLVSSPASAHDKVQFELNYGMFNTDGMVEQDVFIKSAVNANKVLRIPVAKVANHMDATLYGSAIEPPFEPMKAEPTESYPMGENLGIKLKDWLKAKGSGSYTCDGNKATLKATFQNLVPNGVYTMWSFIDLDPPVDPWQGVMAPAGNRDGSQSIFKADAKGNAIYNKLVEPCPQLSGSQSLAGLAIAWHSDGKTYGFSPGGLGVVAHAQLMTLFPHAGDR